MSGSAKPPPSALTIELASIMRGLVARHKVAPKDLAAALDISTGQLSKLLNGKKQIDMDQLDIMCVALGVDIVDILREADEKTAIRHIDPDEPRTRLVDAD